MPHQINHTIGSALSSIKLLSLLSIVMLSGCVEDMLPDPYGFQWVNPSNGDIFYENDVLPGSTTLTLSYTSTPPADVSFSFNSQPVQNCFAPGVDSTLEADLYCLKDFFVQGENRLKVNKEGFGPQVTFTIETQGPKFAVREVDYAQPGDSLACSQGTEGVDNRTVDVTVEYRDPSPIVSSSLASYSDSYEPFLSDISALEASRAANVYSNDNDPVIAPDKPNLRTFTVDVGCIYEFISEDSAGGISVVRYRADGLAVDQTVEARVDVNFLQAIYELVEEFGSGLSGTSPDAPYIPTGDTLITDVAINAYELGKIEFLRGENGGLNGFEIDENGRLLANLNIVSDPEQTGSVRENPGAFFDVDIRIFGFIPINNTKVWVDPLEIRAEVDLSVNAQGEFEVQLVEDCSAIGLRNADVDANGSRFLSGIIGGLIDGCLLKDLIILPLVNSTLIENAPTELLLPFLLENGQIIGSDDLAEDETLDDRIESCVASGSSDNCSASQVQINPVSFEVRAADGNRTADILVSTSGKVATLRGDNEVDEALGSFLIDEGAGLPAPSETAALGVTLNTNVINQGLLSAYNSGVTHFVFVDGNLFNGAKTAKDLSNLDQLAIDSGIDYEANEGDIAISLIPYSPGQFFIGENANVEVDKAYLEFNSAVLKVSFYNLDEWKEAFTVDVDIRAGVIVAVENSMFNMTIAETPEFEIRSISQSNERVEIPTPFGSIWIDFNLSSDMLNFMVNEALNVAIPFVAESALSIDVSQIPGFENLNTQKVTGEGGQLSFEIGTNQAP